MYEINNFRQMATELNLSTRMKIMYNIVCVFTKLPRNDSETEQHPTVVVHEEMNGQSTDEAAQLIAITRATAPARNGE